MSTELNAVDAAESAVENGFDADGNISDENMAAALTGGELEPVVEPELEPEGEVKVEPAADLDTEKPSAADDDAQGDPKTDKDDVPTGVLSKKGDFIIPYEDLIKERDGRQAATTRADGLQEQLDAANKRLTEVTTPAGDDLATDPEPGAQDDAPPDKQKVISQEALDEMIEDYPAAGAAIMALVKSNELLVKQVGDLENQSEQNAVTTAQGTHFNTIADAHKDYEETLSSDEFSAWMDGMPAISKAAYQQVFDGGTADEVISMLNDFVATTSSGDEPPDPDVDPDKKIAEAEAKAENKNKAPVSLSDIPGSVQPHDEQNALIEMSQGNFMDKMNNLSAADQLAVMDKML